MTTPAAAAAAASVAADAHSYSLSLQVEILPPHLKAGSKSHNETANETLNRIDSSKSMH